jgi:MinD superfamily P-loop ATPase
MKEIVIISGKGGTGKTSITASFAMLGGLEVIVGDCDVDAADMHLLLKPDFAKAEDFYSGELAVINQEDCINCGVCKEKCRFDAIQLKNEYHWIDPLSCEGCGYCARICASNAIQNIPVNVGQCYISKIKTGSTMVHAKLGIGADNSGKLVAKVKNEAKQIAKENNKEIIIIDGSPGVGCPVVSSLSGANFAVLVTEPSMSGIHDLKRVYQLVKKFQIKAGCIINKYDINKNISNEIIDFLTEENILHICNIPYNQSFTKAMTKGQCITEYDDIELKTILTDSWTKILETVNN